MQVDYILVGQGLCGTWLSYHLGKLGAKVLVVDRGIASSASYAASGLINPITGKRLARQWMGETINPFAEQAYAELGSLLGVSLAKPVSIHTFFSTAEEASFFEEKAQSSHEDVLHFNGSLPGAEHFNYHYGLGSIRPALYIDVHSMLQGWRSYLKSEDAILEEVFDWNACQFTEAGIKYRDISVRAIIDCGGAQTERNPYFNRLPFALNKGEAIVADIPRLPRGDIYKYAHLSIVPWENNTFWIGSTFNWDFTDELPTVVFRAKAENILKQWLRLPFRFLDHFAAIRPATVTRDAFVGLHPIYPQIGILNGMGSKGCALAPFLAHNLAEHLAQQTPLIPKVDVKRYERVLSR